MKLTKNLFFDDSGKVKLKEAGWVELYNFCHAIICKNAVKHNSDYFEDLTTEAMLKCVDKLDFYSPEKNTELGGWLYWVVRGFIKDKEIDYLRNIPAGTPQNLTIIKVNRGEFR